MTLSIIYNMKVLSEESFDIYNKIFLDYLKQNNFPKILNIHYLRNFLDIDYIHLKKVLEYNNYVILLKEYHIYFKIDTN